MSNPITDVRVDYHNQDGNAFAILGTVGKAMKRAGIEKEIVDQFYKDATSGDYDHLLDTVHEYVHFDY